MMYRMRMIQRQEDNEEFVRPLVIVTFLHPSTQNNNQLVDWSGDERVRMGQGGVDRYSIY